MIASSVSVAFPASRATERQVTELTVVQEEYRHDIAVYAVAGNSASKPYYRSGSPVQIGWSKGRERSIFNGYVHHVEPGNGPLKVWCKGASTRFENGLQTNYRYRTVPSVAAEIARQINFDTEITGHGRVFEAITATGGRIWQLLVEYAQEIGYTLYAKNTRLFLHPRLQTVERFASQAPVFVEGGGRGGLLREFRPLDGAAQPGGVRHNHVFQGVDRRTGRPFAVAGGPAVGRLGKAYYTASGTTFHNLDLSTPEEARWKAVAFAENERFNSRAIAVVDGAARVHQTWPVILSGVDPQYLGTWFVHKATHRIRGNYTMELELGRDGHGPMAVAPDERARRVIATRNTPTGRPKSEYPPSTLVNGQWRSAWSSPAVR